MKCTWMTIALAGTMLASTGLFAADCATTAVPPANVGRAFKLSVFDAKNAPLANVKVTLGTIDRYNTLHPVSRGITDGKGVLNFVKLTPGSYTLQLVDASGERRAQSVQVSANGVAETEFHWPYVYWIPLHNGSGFLMRNNEPVRHWHVTLQGFPDGNELVSSDTDNLGRFDLQVNRSGKYYIDLSQVDSFTGSNRSKGKIPVVVTLDNPTAKDWLFVQEGACGITYDQFCRLGPAQLNGGCVQLLDPSGVAIANAAAKLTSPSGAETNFKADGAGVVHLPNLSAGDYSLDLFAPGYTPIQRTVTPAGGDGSCSTMNMVTMTPFGAGCGPAATPGKAN